MTDQPTTTTRSIELEIEVPGTPEEVWDAIATGPGISSWYCPMTVEAREGGEITMDWGSFGTTTGQVETWDPPHRFRYEGPGDQPLAFEWLVEARDGGSSVVRLVNSGFGHGDDWDDQYHGMTDGWKVFLEHLRLRLTHFRGRHASVVSIPSVSLTGPNDAGWAAFCDGLGLPADAAVGDWIATGGGLPEVAGRVEAIIPSPARTYLLLVDTPMPGTGFITVEGDGDQVAGSAWLYLHADGPAVEEHTDFDQTWTSALFDRFTPAGLPEATSAE